MKLAGMLFIVCDCLNKYGTNVCLLHLRLALLSSEHLCIFNFHGAIYMVIFSQPSIYINGWLYGMSMTSVVCNVPVMSQNDSTYHHSVFTTWKWHPFATWTPSFIILVWGHQPLIGAKTVFACLQNSLLLLKRRSINKFRHRYSMLRPLSVNSQKYQRTVGYPSTSWASCLSIHVKYTVAQSHDYVIL